MPQRLHRFECDGRRYALDPETCFCFECDEISAAVLEHYPEEPVNRILGILGERFARQELEEVIGELEWLRATRSILQPPKQEALARRYELERGLRELTVVLDLRDAGEAAGGAPAEPAVGGWRRWISGADAAEKARNSGAGNAPAAPVAEAGRLLLARSATQKELHLRVLAASLDFFRDTAFLSQWEAVLRELRTLAAWSGKALTVSVGVRLPDTAADTAPEPLRGQDYTAWFTLSPEKLAAADGNAWRALGVAKCGRLDQTAKSFTALRASFEGRLSVTPRGESFPGLVTALEKLGFPWMELDWEAAFAATPGLDAAAVGRSLKSNADDYADALLQGRMFRAEPFATLFLQIFHGTPAFRRDPSGANALAVDAGGGVFPGPGFFGREAFRAGTLAAPPSDADGTLARFEDVGALTTSPCVRCWAAGLCGGGSAAVHTARTGDFRTPDPAWCDAWRGWIEGAIAAFSRLSGAGVNFTRVFDSVAHRGKPSLLSLVKALRQRVGMRPLEEADAPLLVRWENWNHASYFTFTEHGTLLGAQYDREMDALHPVPGVQELLITGRGGRPLGLVRVAPGPPAGTAWLWLYMRREEDYRAERVSAALGELAGQALAATGLKRILAPAAPEEEALAACLRAAGFSPAGTLRGALFFKGSYRDVQVHVRESDAAAQQR